VTHRLAIVQHGDYAKALRLIRDGGPEPYFGMYYSVATLEKLSAGTEYLLVSMGAPPYRQPHGETGQLVGIASPSWKKAATVRLAWQMWRAVRAFRPTHLLLRTGGEFALPILHDAISRNVDTLVMMANYMTAHTWREHVVNRWLVRLLNDPAVHLVGNHRVPAAESLVAWGVRRAKVVAWDWPDQPCPSDFPVKTAPPEGGCHIAYAGEVFAGKGVGDLIEAVLRLNRSGHAVRLTICGDGPDRDALQGRVSVEPGAPITFLGRVTNEQVQQLMRAATVVCVPTRKESYEGSPKTATEALASRTPLIASDHPALTHLLRDGEGLTFFRSGDPESLARAILRVTADPEVYRRLSEGTAAAHARLACPTRFHEVIERWRASWGQGDAADTSGNQYDFVRQAKTIVI
jgi:glycosyltransferase involved in cell wall biosynthesis